jgi:hypothetical protein
LSGGILINARDAPGPEALPTEVGRLLWGGGACADLKYWFFDLCAHGARVMLDPNGSGSARSSGDIE